MIAMTRIAAVLAAMATIAGCSFGSTRPPSYDYSTFVASDPRSVLVAPMTAQSDEARQYLALVAQPLAERGYYVMPVRMTQELMAEEGYQERAMELRRQWRTDYDAGDSHWTLIDENKHPGVFDMASELIEMSGADSVLFVYVLEWGHKIDTSEGFLSNMIDDKKNHTINLDYLLVGDAGETLWRARKRVEFTRGGGGFFSEIWNASRKAPDAEISATIARDVNRLMIEAKRTQYEMTGSWYQGYAMLVGPYHPSYEADRARRQPAPAPAVGE